MEIPYQIRDGENLGDRCRGVLKSTPLMAACSASIPFSSDHADPCDLWYGFGIPTINQIGNSCDGECWNNILEMMIRRAQGRAAIPAGYQMDGHAAWRRACEMFFGKDYTGGIYLHQGWMAMVDLGWIPAGSMTMHVSPTWNEVNAALKDSPLAIGSSVDNGWSAPDKFGCIDESYPPDQNSGHAWPLVGTHVQRAGQVVGGQMSWGSDYADRGWFYMTWGKFQSSLMGSSILAPYFNGDISTWTGYQKGLVKRRE
jgi:hypothetical protein